MGYQRGATTQVSVLSVEQARRRNAELRRELATLTAENTALEAQVATARLQVTEARRLLTRKVRDLDAARAQVDRLGAVQPSLSSAEPVYGGREGLEAATRELEEHEAKGVEPRPRRVRKGPSHGTERRYRAGCRCDDCMAWRKRRSEQVRLVQQQRRNTQKRAA